MGERHWTVTLKVFAFETEQEARDYADKLTDAFCDMPESEGYGSACRVEVECDE